MMNREIIYADKYCSKIDLESMFVYNFKGD